jgi:hypothetical protein
VPRSPRMSLAQPNQSPFAESRFNQPPRKSGVNWLLALVLIGLGMLTLGGAVCIGGAWYVATHIEQWVVGLGREAVVAAIKDSELPAEEKEELITQVDRVVTAYKEHKINQADLQRVFEELQDSPPLKALALFGIEDAYLDGTNLTAKEVEQGRRTFQRALRAVYEGKISDEDFYAALPADEDDQIRLASNKPAENSSDDDLRLSLAKLKVMADNAGIPDEPFQLHLSQEVKKIVDRALDGKK